MRRLSSSIRPRVVRRSAFGVYAVVLLAVLALAILWLCGYQPGTWLWPAFVAGALVQNVLNGAIVPLAWPGDALDEAWLDGEDLLLRRDNQSMRVPLDDLAMVDAEARLSLITLTLRVPSILGDIIRFRTPRGAAREIRSELHQRLHDLQRDRDS